MLVRCSLIPRLSPLGCGLCLSGRSTKHSRYVYVRASSNVPASDCKFALFMRLCYLISTYLVLCLCCSCCGLQELVLDDALAGKVSKTLLFKLSESKALSHFRRVVLVSSPKDQYVPAYSARIQVVPINP